MGTHIRGSSAHGFVEGPGLVRPGLAGLVGELGWPVGWDALNDSNMAESSTMSKLQLREDLTMNIFRIDEDGLMCDCILRMELGMRYRKPYRAEVCFRGEKGAQADSRRLDKLVSGGKPFGLMR